jgi:hypothetical protein
MVGLTGLQQWYAYRLGVGELARADKKNPRFVLSEHLLEDAKANNPRNKFTTPGELASFLKEMACEHKSNGKKWGWIFPPLAEARHAWLLSVGGNWEWLAPDVADWGEKPGGA